jgi:hypothetical chaperone protein
MRALGLDFGTTNSALAVAAADGRAELAEFRTPVGSAATFRSILHFHPEIRERGGRLVPAAGPRAIERFLEAEGEGRLIQSPKSFLASRLFHSTTVYGTVFSLQTLIGFIVRALREEAEARLGPLGARVVVGRPVRFANASDPDHEELALRRLRAALENAGFREVGFELEPVAAALHYESGLDHDELVLIGDFGGGTSDFSLVRVGPGARRLASQDGRDRVLATDGVGIAGDAFDAKIVRHLVAPALGRGARFRSVFGRVLPVPTWIYSHLERWHHLSFLRSRKTLQLLLDLRREALEPEKLEGLVHLVTAELGFALYRAVEHVKHELSRAPLSRFAFHDGPVSIEADVARADFEGWIEEELAEIAGCVDAVLAAAGASAADVDRVFLTGGSSFVPAVIRIFEERFGAERIRRGGELTSVASGLALSARATLGESA